ncbi:MAG: phosphoribosylglycinamide formyltransferase [Bacteroidota bacterium]
MKKRIVIFASGSGTNAQNIIEYFQQDEFAEVVRVLSNKKDAKVLDRSKALKIQASSFTKEQLHSENGVLKTLQSLQPDLIVLAGFLWKFPELILQHFPNKVVNIHPALLPKYGGKGMYGKHVHEAVVAHGETETGITIHYVNEHYDEGAIICQKKVAISEGDNAEGVAKKVHELEYRYFPQVIEEILRGMGHLEEQELSPKDKEEDHG